MIAFNLITGFLGSGKTTLLSNLLEELAPRKRIAVIQNEFSPSGIDGKELKSLHRDFRLVEINNGSVFCVCQLPNFVHQIVEIIENYQPEIIFLEATGLADPISIAEILQDPVLASRINLDRIICLLDAPNFFRGLSALTRFKHQIMIADHLIINKIDLFEGELEPILEQVKMLNPFATITPSSYAKINWKDPGISSLKKGEASQRFRELPSGVRPDLRSSVLRTHDKIELLALKQLIAELQTHCIRIKGYVNLTDGRLVSVQLVYDQIAYKMIPDYLGPTELIIFSSQMTAGSLRKKWKEYL